MNRVRKGISYVIGDSTDFENHILPINAIQYSNKRRQLFTGGRDGIIKVWNSSKGSNNPFTNGTASGLVAEDCEESNDINEDLLKLETSISSNPMPYNPIDNEYLVLQSYNLHFDWINDLQLVNNDRHLVSCSSDLSLKLINLTSDASKDDDNEVNVHKFSNVHTDYVKKLSYCNNNHHTVISGGLDGKIVLWDLNHLSPTRTIENNLDSSITNSIYSLSNNNSNLISCGGPNNTINIFDKRLQLPFIKKLIGHQDNVRCLLMSDNFILSGSSDCTIKLWDLRNFKMFKNFDIHDDPVWCLNSAGANSGSDDFRTFYSADKSGTILKTDLSCLAFDSDDSALNDRLGLSTVVAKGDSSIISLGIESLNSKNNNCDNSIFVSDDMSLKRYHVPNTSKFSHYQYLRVCQDIDDQMINDDPNNEANNENDLNSDLYDLVSHLSMETTTNVDIQSTLSNPQSQSVGQTNVDSEEEDTSEYDSMFLCVNGGPSMEFVNIDKNENHSKLDKLNIVDNTPVEILLNPVSPEQITIIPFNKRPLNTYQLTPKSIIAKRLFNNKRWMLVLYLNGDITIWDIFICRRIKTFTYDSNKSIEITSEMIKNRIQDMDNIFQEYQTTDTLNNWCEVEIKSGKLLVTLSETTFNNVEIYYDELVDNYPFLNIDHDADAKRNSKIKVTNDDRLQLTRILLNSIFHNYALYEWEFDKRLREELKGSRSHYLYNGHSNGNGNGNTNGNGIENGNGNSESGGGALNRIKMFSRKSSSNNIYSLNSKNNSVNNSNNNSANVSVNDLTLDSHDDPVIEFLKSATHADTDANGAQSSSGDLQLNDSINTLLLEDKNKYLERLQNSKSKLPETALKIYSNSSEYNKNHLTSEEFIGYKPLINLDQLPSNLLIIIFENSPNLGNLRDVFSFRLNDLKNLQYGTHNGAESIKFVKELRNYLPKWIGYPILYDKFPIKESPKIAFQLLELDYTSLPPDLKINGKSQRKIKRLPVLESSIKLTSHNMLRVSKILSYLTEKFESRTSEMKDKIPPTQWLVLECRGQELQNNMTLQTIKSKIWKSSSDIELRFRRKFDK